MQFISFVIEKECSEFELKDIWKGSIKHRIYKTGIPSPMSNDFIIKPNEPFSSLNEAIAWASAEQDIDDPIWATTYYISKALTLERLTKKIKMNEEFYKKNHELLDINYKKNIESLEKMKKNGTVKCYNCKSSINTSFLKTTRCPVCKFPHMKIRDDYDAVAIDLIINERKRKYNKVLWKFHESTKKIGWVFTGWVSL